MGWLGAKSTFIKHSKVTAPDSSYPDGGCNIEIYTSPKFAEMEFLGPVETVYPGNKIELAETWQLLPKSFTPEQWREIFNYYLR